MKLKKIVTAVVASAMLACSLCLLTGCNSDEKNEQVITESLTQELDSLKNPTGDVVKGLFDEDEELAELGITVEDFATAYLDGFDYSIDSVKVDGEEAVATVTITCKLYTNIEKALNQKIEDLTNDKDFMALSEKKMKKQLGQELLAAVKSVENTSTTLEINYTLENDAWTPTAESTAAIEKALQG